MAVELGVILARPRGWGATVGRAALEGITRRRRSAVSKVNSTFDALYRAITPPIGGWLSTTGFTPPRPYLAFGIGLDFFHFSFSLLFFSSDVERKILKNIQFCRKKLKNGPLAEWKNKNKIKIKNNLGFKKNPGQGQAGRAHR